MNKIKFVKRLPYLFSSALLGTIASYIIYIHISKQLGFEDFSKVSYWMNLGAIFTVVYDLGINQYLQVNYAKDIKVLSESLLGLKLVLGLTVSLLLALFVHETAVYFFLTSFLCVSFQAFFSYYLRLQQRFFFDVVFNLSYYAIFVLAFLYLLRTSHLPPTQLYAWFHFIMRSLLLLCIFGLFIFAFRQKVRLDSIFKNRSQLKKIAGFSFLSLLVVSTQNVDALILYRTIGNPELFSKLSMVIKIGFLNYAFFDSFITLVSAAETKEGKGRVDMVSRQFKTCLLFGVFISLGIHVMALLLPYVVGAKWAGISEMSAWAIGNNISLYVLLFFQFKLLALGKVRLVAFAMIMLIAGSSLISYFFVSYPIYFILNALLKLAVASGFSWIYRRQSQPQVVHALQFSEA